MRRLRDLFSRHGAPQARLVAGYGTTETGGLVAGAEQGLAPASADAEPAELGPPAPGVDLRVVGPEGPVFLGGNCQGALIALAIAQHLLRRGRHVPLLVLMEWGVAPQPYGGRVLTSTAATASSAITTAATAIRSGCGGASTGTGAGPRFPAGTASSSATRTSGRSPTP